MPGLDIDFNPAAEQADAATFDDDNLDGGFLDDEVARPQAGDHAAQVPLMPGVDSAVLMPRAFTIGGLQRTVNNLTADVHQGMKQWSHFHTALKALECLLRVDERRQRFIWTCLQGTPLEGRGFRFQKFKGSLYESRWREVLGFLKKLSNLLPTLAKAWDSAKYIRGVNAEGLNRPVQASAERQQNERQGLAAFDPERITAALKSPLFHSYVAMALLREEIPEALASSVEACPCHRELFKHVSEHKRRKALEQHFGQGLTTCPMSGKLLPELVAGELESVFEQICSVRETSLSLLPLPGLRSLTGEEWNALMSDFRSGSLSRVGAHCSRILRSLGR